MSHAASVSGRVLELADEFLARYRRGERPPVAEYTERHPELSEEIREVFPAMAMMENIAIDASAPQAGGPAAPSAAAEPALKQLGDYRIIREVGRGGMGIVYEAEQVSLGRHVALKVLPRQIMFEGKQKRRFEREAKAAAKLHHTNIVPVFGVGEQDGMNYYVMQFIQGLGLNQVLDELRQLQGGRGASGTPAARGSQAAPSRLAADATAADVARSLMRGEFERTSIEPSEPGQTEPARLDVPDQGAQSAYKAEIASGRERTSGLVLDGPGATIAEGSESVALSSRRETTAGRQSDPSLSGSAILPGQSGSHSSARIKRPTYWQSVANLGVQVAGALRYAHDQGILHRDIKPSNLLLDLRGTVWITDFGLAKSNDQQEITHTGDILGTLRYMPPEAFEGQADPRGDIYSLGLTLYEMLVLKPAFDDRDRQKLIKLVTTTEPTRLEKLNREIPRDLATIVHKAIDRDPEHRYAAAQALADDLQRFIDDEPIVARRQTYVEQFFRWARRHKGIAALGGALAAVLLIVFVGLAVATGYFRKLNGKLGETVAHLTEAQGELQRSVDRLTKTQGELENARDRAKQQAQSMEVLASETEAKRIEADQARAAESTLRNQEVVARAEAERQKEIARRIAYSSSLLTAARLQEAPDQEARLAELLADLRPQAGERDLRGWEWYYFKSLARESPSTQLELADRAVAASMRQGGAVHALAWSPEGTRLAAAGFDRAVRIWDPATQELQAILGNSDKSGAPVAAGHAPGAAAVDWSPAGDRIVACGADGVIRVWDVARRSEIHKLSGHGGHAVHCVRWGPEGSWLASGGADRQIVLWNAATGQQLQTLRGHQDEVVGLDWSADGKWLASVDRAGAIKVWKVENGLEMKAFGRTGERLWCVKFARDGRRLVTGGEPAQERGVLFEGRAATEGVIRLWDLDSQAELLIFRGHVAPVMGVDLSADGNRLLSASQDGTVKLWDVETARELISLADSQRRGYWCAQFSPDGLQLAAAGSAGAIEQWDTFAGHAQELSLELLPPLSRRIAAHESVADLTLRGRILSLAGRWDEAAADFRRALELVPAEAERPAWFTSPWWVAGPYPRDLHKSFPPEQSLDPFVPLPAAVESAGGKPLVWSPLVLQEAEGINLGRYLHEAANVSGYAQMRIYSPREQEVGLLIAADDQSRWWFNGRVVHASFRDETAVRDREAVEITLHEGWNTLLARVSNNTGRHGLLARLTTDSAALATAYENNQMWAEALRAWQRVLSDRPDDASAWLRHGRAALGVHDHATAKKSFAAFVNRRHDEAGSFSQLAHVYHDAGFQEESVEWLDRYNAELESQTVQHPPDSARADQLRVGRRLAAQWRIELARHEWAAGRRATAFRLWRDGIDRLTRLADEAAADGQIAVALSEARRVLAEELAKAGLWDEAAPHYGKALAQAAVNPASAADLLDRRLLVAGAAALLGGDVERYRTICRELLEKLGDPDHLQSNPDREAAAQVAHLCSLIPGAVDDAQKLLLLAEQATFGWLAYPYALALYRSGRYAEAVETAEAARRGAGALVVCDLVRAMALYRTGQSAAANELLETVDQKTPGIVDQWMWRSHGGLSADWVILRSEAHRLIRSRDYDVDERRRRATAYLDLGEFAKADLEMAALAAENPRDPRAHFLRARFLADRGANDEAADEFREALALLKSSGKDVRSDPAQLGEYAAASTRFDQRDEAETALRQAIARQTQSLTPRDARAQKKLSALYCNLNGLLAAKHDPAALEKSQREQQIAFESQGVKLLHEIATAPQGIERLAITPDGRRAILAGNHSAVEVWDLVSGQRVRILAHSSPANAVDLSADGALALTCSGDGAVRLWDLATGAHRQVQPGLGRSRGSAFTEARFSPDGRFVVNLLPGDVIRIWEAETGADVQRLRGSDCSGRVFAFSPDGRRLLSACSDGALQLWDVVTGRGLLRLTAHTSTVMAICFSSDGRLAASTATDGSLILWNLERGDLLGRMALAGSGRSVGFLPGDRLVFYCGGASGISFAGVCDPLAGRRTEITSTSSGSYGHLSAQRLPDGQRFLTGDSNGALREWSFPLLDSPEKAAATYARCVRGAAGNTELVHAIVEEAAGVDAVVEELARRLPDEPAVLAALSRSRNARGESQRASPGWHDAVRLYEGALQQHPEDSALAGRLARALIESGPSTRSLDNAEQSSWNVLTPAEMKSEGGATLARQEDGALLAGGANPGNDCYVLRFDAHTRRFSALRIEFLPHDSFPNHGSGRGPSDGNAVVSEIEASVVSSDGRVRPIRWQSAESDHEVRPEEHYNRLPIRARNLIDGRPLTYWETWPAPTAEHQVTLRAGEDVECPPDSVLEVRIRNSTYHVGSNPGRFRISLAAEAAPATRLSARSPTEAWGQLGTAYALAGQTSKSAAAFARAVALADGDAQKSACARRAAQFGSVAEELARLCPREPALFVAFAELWGAGGNQRRASEARHKAVSLYEEELVGRPDDAAIAGKLSRVLVAGGRALPTEPGWTVPEPAELASLGGATLTVQPDGSILAGGVNPEQDAYAIVLRPVPAGVTAVRLETIPDPRLPHGGCGRAPQNGHFDLAEFSIALRDSSGAFERPIPIAQAWSDVVGGNGDAEIRLTLDDKAHTSWNVWPTPNLPHYAVFKLARPVSPERGEAELVIRMSHAHVQHNIGRFRLSLTRDEGEFSLEMLRTSLVHRKLSGFAALGAAYTLCGKPVPAASAFARALDRAPDAAQKIDWAREAMRSLDVAQELQKIWPEAPSLLAALANDVRDRSGKGRLDDVDERVIGALKQFVLAHPGDELVSGALADLLFNVKSPTPPAWNVLRPSALSSKGGARFSVLDDGSILVSGPNLDGDVYRVTVDSPIAALSAVRLEVLPDDSLPGNGPGRHSSGNFQLEKFRLLRPRPGGDEWARFGHVRASYAYDAPNVDVSALIDDDARAAWHIWGQTGRAHFAEFFLAAPLLLAADRTVAIEITNHPGEVTNLGRFRLLAREATAAIGLDELRVLIESGMLSGRLKLAAAHLTAGDAQLALETLEMLPQGSEAGAQRDVLMAIARDALKQQPAARECCARIVTWLGARALSREMQPLVVETLTRIGGQSRRQVRTLLAESAIAADLARVSRKLDGMPESAHLHNERGRLLARIGRWRESAQDFVCVTQFAPGDRLAWAQAAASLLLAGDETGYRRLCQGMVAQFRESSALEVADVVCKTCLLRPKAIELADLPIQNVRDPAGDPTWEPFRSYFQACQALIAYRRGSFNDALAACQKLADLRGDAGTLALVVRAMAEQRLGRHEAARQSLAQVDAQLPRALRTLGGDDHEGSLPVPDGIVSHDWLIPEILRREAAALIDGKPAGPGN